MKLHSLSGKTAVPRKSWEKYSFSRVRPVPAIQRGCSRVYSSLHDDAHVFPVHFSFHFSEDGRTKKKRNYALYRCLITIIPHLRIYRPVVVVAKLRRRWWRWLEKKSIKPHGVGVLPHYHYNTNYYEVCVRIVYKYKHILVPIQIRNSSLVPSHGIMYSVRGRCAHCAQTYTRKRARLYTFAQSHHTIQSRFAYLTDACGPRTGSHAPGHRSPRATASYIVMRVVGEKRGRAILVHAHTRRFDWYITICVCFFFFTRRITLHRDNPARLRRRFKVLLLLFNSTPKYKTFRNRYVPVRVIN